MALTLKGFAQSSVYHPFPDSNATWNVEWNNGWWVCIEDFSYSLDGDTMISNVIYHKINTPYIQNLGICNTIHQIGYKGCIRQDTSARKVYYIAPDSTTEDLLYDFNLQVGDSVQGFLRFNCFTITLAVIEIDSILIGTNYRKRWTTGTAIPYKPYNRIIEGIGFETGLLQQCPISETDIPFYSLLCFQQDGIAIYPNTQTNCHLIDDIKNYSYEPTVEIFPNPANEKIFIHSSTKIVSLKILDITGRDQGTQLLWNDIGEIDIHSLADGIYFLQVETEKGIFAKRFIKK